MVCSIFGSSHPLPLPALAAAAVPLAVLIAAAAAFLYKALDETISLDVLLGPRPAKLLALLSYAALAAFWWRVLWPLLPDRIFGALFWPMRLGAPAALRHSLILAALGAASFCLASKRASPRLILSGTLAGLACGCAGFFANSGLHASGALWKISHRTLAGLLLAGIPVLFSCLAASWLLLAAGLKELRSGPRLLLGLAGFALLAIPVELLQAYLRRSWDFAQPSLADAAGVPGAEGAETLTVAILADPDGRPGVRSREELLSAEGLAAGPMDLLKIDRYLQSRAMKTVFVGQGLRALRRGWALNWEPHLIMNAALLNLEPGFPPDYEAFLACAAVAPATPDNFGRIEKLSKHAWDAKITSVKQAQKIFEGFSTAYARFGDLEASNRWMERIQRLWPLYEEPIHVEPIADRQDGRISGRLLLDGEPAPGVKVGLFALPSTMTAVSAAQYLCASAFPDESGRFRFDSLLPGRYYLALQAASGLLPKGLSVRRPPGVIVLSFGDMQPELILLEAYSSPRPFEPYDPLPEEPPPEGIEFLLESGNKRTNSVLK